MTDIEEIRARHEAVERSQSYMNYIGDEAHADRATLLRALTEAQERAERAEAWTDDDQRGLNAAVADAMWYWDDMPMDPDDAISLTGILKDRLQENGFQIVRAPLETKP